MSEEATQHADPPAEAAAEVWLDEMTPRQIVAELDKYIVGQDAAKKAVAIALRNRWRRQRVDEDLREEIAPNNIIMIGPTGVGKTEIARRLARLAGAPFVKVEASKFTEVGYVGRDVESMIRDLVDMSVNMVRTEREDEVQEEAEKRVEERLLDLLIPPVSDGSGADAGKDTLEERLRAFVVSSTGQVEDRRTEEEKKEEKPVPAPGKGGEDDEARQRRERTREKFRALLRDGKLEDREVEVEVSQSFPMENMMVPLRRDGGDGQPLRDAPGLPPQADQAAPGDRGRGAPHPQPGRAGQAGQHGRGGGRGAGPRRADGDRLPGRDRQDRRGAGRRRRARRVARGGAARPPPRGGGVHGAPPSTGSSAPTTCSSSRPGPSTSPSPPT